MRVKFTDLFKVKDGKIAAKGYVQIVGFTMIPKKFYKDLDLIGVDITNWQKCEFEIQQARKIKMILWIYHP